LVIFIVHPFRINFFVVMEVSSNFHLYGQLKGYLFSYDFGYFE